MNSSYRNIGIAALVALVIGFCIGFIPEHTKSSNQQEQIATLTQGKAGVEGQLGQIRNDLALSGFAIQSALVYADAEKNNYSVASGGASNLFTDLRKYADQNQGTEMQQLTEVLSARDRTIAGLAKADPAVKPLLQDIFRKLQALQANAVKGS